MALIYLFCVALVIIVGFYIYFTWTFDYWERLNVPFEPPTVFVGNMTFALRENMAAYMERLYRKFEGYDCFGIWMFRTPILVVRSPEMAKEILVTKFKFFMNKIMETDESDILGSKALILLKDEQWTRLRHKLSPAFTRAKMRNILLTRMPTISKELQRLIDKEYIGNSNDMKTLFMKYLVEVVAGTIFGIRANSMQDNNAPIFKLGMSFVDWTVFRGMELMSIFLFPRLTKLFKFQLFSQGNSDFMRSLFMKILESREKEKSDLKTQPRDVVDALLQLKDSDLGNDFTEDDIIAQAGLFFFAGFETTSTTLTFICYELAFNQIYQERLYQEIKKSKAEKTAIDLDELDGLKLLDMGIKETLRKYPILSFSDRLCGEDCELSNGFVAKKNMKILICTGGLHHDEKYFPEPDQWDPYRFENEKDFVPFTYLPFSEGRRICIGAKYATMSMKMTLYALIERYRFEPCADTVPPQELRLNPYSIVSSADGPIMLNIIQR